MFDLIFSVKNTAIRSLQYTEIVEAWLQSASAYGDAFIYTVHKMPL